MRMPRIYSANFVGFMSVIAEFENEEIVSVDFGINDEGTVETAISLAEKVTKMEDNETDFDIGVDENAVMIRYTAKNGKNKIYREWFASEQEALTIASFIDDILEEMRTEA